MCAVGWAQAQLNCLATVNKEFNFIIGFQKWLLSHHWNLAQELKWVTKQRTCNLVPKKKFRTFSDPGQQSSTSFWEVRCSWEITISQAKDRRALSKEIMNLKNAVQHKLSELQGYRTEFFWIRINWTRTNHKRLTTWMHLHANSSCGQVKGGPGTNLGHLASKTHLELAAQQSSSVWKDLHSW